MTRPNDVANVAANTDATSAWANDVADGINAILDDIYAAAVGGPLAIPWAAITGAPAEYDPIPHAHDWADITGEPATYPPTVHDHSAGAGGGNVPWANVSGKPVTFAPTLHAAAHSTGQPDAMSAANINGWIRASAGGGAAGTKISVGTTAPVAPAEGDVWIKG